MIEIRCANCDLKISVPTAQEEDTIQCPRCFREIALPNKPIQRPSRKIIKDPRSDRKWNFMFFGAILGAFVAYLFRPSAMFVGQVPFSHVITRGAMLEGLDQILIPTAQRSFNLLLGGVILGGIAGAMFGYHTYKK